MSDTGGTRKKVRKKRVVKKKRVRKKRVVDDNVDESELSSFEKRRRDRERRRVQREAERKKVEERLLNKGKGDDGDSDDDSDSHGEDFNPSLANDDISDDSEDSDMSSEERERQEEAKRVAAAVQQTGGGGGANIFERMGQEDRGIFTTKGGALISALAGGKDLSKYEATHGSDSDSDDDDGPTDTKLQRVNMMTFNREDKADEYGDIFGKDLEWFPDGLRMWKLEKFIPKAISPINFTPLLNRETYIVLHISENDLGAKTCAIYTWLGSETSMDKSGGAAFRIGELQGFMHAMSGVNEISAKFKQYREEEGEESDQFKELFEEYDGFRVEDGGSLSDFVKVETEAADPTLYCVVAEEHTHEVALDDEHLNQRNVFLLDAGKVLFVWNGRKATYFDRFRCVELASKLANKDRLGRSVVIQVDDDKNESDNPTLEFWQHFGLVRPPNSIRDDYISYDPPAYRMWRTQNLDGKFDLVEVTDRPLTKNMLNGKHCIILDTFFTVYNWKGSHSSPLERAASELLAQKFLAETADRPAWAKIKNVLESAEPELFKEKFDGWGETVVEQAQFNYVADSAPPPSIDVQTLLEEGYWEPDLLDEAEGTIEAWVITGSGPKFEKLTATERGIFWSASCYMVLYSYTHEDEITEEEEQRYRVYFWQGGLAGEQWYPQFMFGFFPVLARRIEGQGRKVDQVHIHQGSEPKHFAMLFQDALVIRYGIRKAPADEDEPVEDWQKEPFLLDIRQQMPAEIVRAIEPAKLTAAFLNSEGTFMLVEPKETRTLWVWYGAASRLFKSHAGFKKVQALVQGGTALKETLEGDEPDQFWELIGGKGKYCHKDRRSQWVPRLFEGYAEDGQLKVREIVNYSQWNLDEQGVFMMDVYDKLYLWYGNQCSATMQQSCITVANTYVRLAATMREMFVGLEMFVSGTEPLEFQYVFHTWVPRSISNARKTQERRKERVRRLMMLQYRSVMVAEAKERKVLKSRVYQIRNQSITQENDAAKSQHQEIEKHNKKLLAQKVEDSARAMAKADRERKRAEKEAAHQKEMEEMETERLRRKAERDARKAAAE